MKVKVLHLLPLFILFIPTIIVAQLSEISFDVRVSQSTVILEGKVIHKVSYWDMKQHNIYTVNTIEVYKIFKGSLTASTIEVITPGGIVGLNKEVVKPSLSLSIDDTGIFMLDPTSVDLPVTSTVLRFDVYSSMQGFVKYDFTSNIAVTPFDIFKDIDKSLYREIQNLTGSTYSTIAPLSTKPIGVNKTIASFSPTTVTAGTTSLITITGTNFGATAGIVRFSNADDGGATFIDGLATEIISWSNTNIVVQVNSEAGTGPIQVVGTGTFTSAQTLTVSHAQINVNFDPGTGTEAYQTRHISDNGTGGYTWQMHTDFDASPANAPFIRALDSWRCNTGINWTIGTTTTVDIIASDNINIIREDNGGELPAGVLGRCTSRFQGCGGATIEWFVGELDIVFDDGTNWNYTTAAPAFTEFDFETVAVHELGHGHQLAHVIDGGDLMHFALSNGSQNRTPNANNLTGGNDVQSRSTGGAVCGQSVMTNHTCSILPIELLSFKIIRKSSDQVKLYWSTTTEKNNKGFIVERMLDNQRGFTPLAWVDGKGTSLVRSNYRLMDNNGFMSTSYYRLKQIDEQGAFSYSEIRAVRNDNLADLDISIFPKFTDNLLKVRFADVAENTSAAIVRILNTNGQLLHQFTTDIQAYQVLEIDYVRNLAPAVYIISIELGNGQKEVQKFIKQ